MFKKHTSLAIAFMALAVISLMYNETPAQKKKGKSSPAAAVEPAAAVPEISYTVGMSKPWTHLLEVEARVKWATMPTKLQLKMAVWTPGSYLIREYAKNVQDLDVRSGSGESLAWQKVSKNTWEVDPKGSKEVVATYSVYANELTVRTNELNADHGFWNNGGTLMYVKDQLNVPSTVTVKPYGNWKVATGLPPVADRPNTFRAPNVDVLFDSPFEVSDFTEVAFTVEGKPHRIVFSGDGNYDTKQCANDVAKIVEEAYKIFGELPYDNYTFIVNLRGGGGLEHLNSTALQYPRFGFKPEARYKGFLGLAAHEYFHAFNVKRIRPDALGPFDYENENYTKLLWVAEGGTEYYSNILLRRAGLISDKEFLAARADGIKQLQERPGRLEQSLEDSSFDAWIKYYRPDENAVNNQISYYDKGELVNMLLDITIRTDSNGTKSLDDVMRALYNDFYKQGKNYTPTDYQRLAEAAAGKPLDDFFSQYVRGTTDPDWAGIFLGIGIQVNAVGQPRAYFGAEMAESGGTLTVRSVPAGTPAYDQGINTGDQIVAIDGYKATMPFLSSYVAEHKPNDKIKLTIFRFDKLREINFSLGSDPRKLYTLKPVESPTADQKKLYSQYLNAEL